MVLYYIFDRQQDNSVDDYEDLSGNGSTVSTILDSADWTSDEYLEICPKGQTYDSDLEECSCNTLELKKNNYFY